MIALGIDGGGTRTRAVIVDEGGRVLARGEGGPSNLNASGRDVVRASIAAAVDEALGDASLGEHARRSAHGDAHRFDAAFLGLAGVVTPHDHEVIRSIARELMLAPDDRIGVDHDLRIALAGGLGGSPGIVLIAGTGSSCYGRNGAGMSHRAGGWGPVLDDPGSGYWLGVRGMAAVGRGVDGRGDHTSLERVLPAALGVRNAEELLRLTGVEGLTRDRIAALAPIVLDAADAGDTVARAIVAEGVDELALMVEAVARTLFHATDVELVMTGGLTERPSLHATIVQAIARRAPRVRVVASRSTPVVGAALLALEMVGIHSTEPGGS